jgi:hypothetical protein
MKAPSTELWTPYWIDTVNLNVHWLGTKFTDLEMPFFDAAARTAIQNKAMEKFTPLLTLHTLKNQWYNEPSGFIFHTSRCGSTLIANLIKHAGNTVLAEPQPVSALLMPHSSGFWKLDNEKYKNILPQLLETLIGLYCENDKKVFVKFSSWNILMIDLIKMIWPRVPCLFMCRHPVEILVSNEQRPAGWIKMKELSKVAEAVTGLKKKRIEQMSWSTFAAEMLRLYFNKGIELKRAHFEKTLVVDHWQLDWNAVQRIFGFFELPQPSEERFVNTFRKHSKTNAAFEDDSMSKRQSASDEIRKSLNPELLDSYSTLQSLLT